MSVLWVSARRVHAIVAATLLLAGIAHAQMPGREPGRGRGNFGTGPGAPARESHGGVRPDLPEGWIDTHVHLRAGPAGHAAALESALVPMEQAGVALSIVMPQPFTEATDNPNRHEFDDFLPALRSHGGRFAFLGGGGSLNGMIGRAHREGAVTAGLRQAFERQAERIAAAGAAGFGEIAIEHLSHFSGHPYESVPADHPLLLALADIAARHGMPIDVHMDVVAESRALPSGLASPPNPPMLVANLAAFERLLSHNRAAKIVLAHSGWDITGQWSPQLSRELLSRHSNLYMSIKINRRGVPEHNPLSPSGVKAEWLELLRDYSDRFVVGSDSFYAAPAARGPGAHVETVGPVQLLARLPKEIAARIGYENAKRIYRLE